jgi:transcriptional regulator with XRE-family HTH domain
MIMRQTLGQKVANERRLKKMTQKELASEFMAIETLIQIEENKVVPSISTLAYIAKRLDKEVDYFMTDESKVEQIFTLTKQLMHNYRSEECQNIIEILDELKNQSPLLFHTEMIRDIYINSHFKVGNFYLHEGRFQDALEIYEFLLSYEHNFILENELLAYELYTRLVDVYLLCKIPEKATEYNAKASQLMKKMLASKEVQNLYLLLTGDDYRKVIEIAAEIDADLLDDYNLARMNMVIGNAHYNLKTIVKP